MSLNIVKYMKSLLPHIEKKDITEDLMITEKELETSVIPSFNQATMFFELDGFKSSVNQAMDNNIKLVLKKTNTSKNKTFLTEYTHRLNLMLANLSFLIKEIDRDVSLDMVTDGLAADRVVRVRIAEMMSFASRTSLDILTLFYINEAMEVSLDQDNIKMSPAEISKANAALPRVISILNSYGIKADEFQKGVMKTPKLVLTRAENKEIDSVYTDRDIDSLSGVDLHGFTANPIYHFRMFIAEWQTRRYHAAKDKKKTLELRLMHLQMVKEKGGSNPKIEKEIAYNQARVSKIEKSLSEIDADLGIASP